jgi:hypothetical protein
MDKLYDRCFNRIVYLYVFILLLFLQNKVRFIFEEFIRPTSGRENIY